MPKTTWFNMLHLMPESASFWPCLSACSLLISPPSKRTCLTFPKAKGTCVRISLLERAPCTHGNFQIYSAWCWLSSSLKLHPQPRTFRDICNRAPRHKANISNIKCPSSFLARMRCGAHGQCRRSRAKSLFASHKTDMSLIVSVVSVVSEKP